jgi:hypothetical protein
MQLLLDIQEPGQTLLAQHWMAAIFSPSGLAGKQKKNKSTFEQRIWLCHFALQELNNT